MNHAGAMRGLERFGDLPRDRQRVSETQAAGDHLA
jgi:hypothetical protein